VQFQKRDDQIKALSECRFPVLGGHQCRVLPYVNLKTTSGRPGQTQAQAERVKATPYTHLFVKGLPRKWQHEDLCSAFEPFGKVISAKVSINPDHSSKGFGYVQFESDKDCQKALKAMNGKVVESESAQEADSVAEECKLAVSEYVSPIDRNGTAARRKLCSNNLYVKSFPTPEWTEEDMRATFDPFGELVSVCIAVDENQKSKQFGFVCFRKAEDAQKALAHFSALGADEPTEAKLYVREAKTKQQRQAEMAMESYKFKKSMMMHNLIVRGQDSACTQDEFEDYFAGFGEVKSVKLIPEARIGFVCFVNKESAKAVLNHPDHMLQGKKLIVAHCKPKEERHTEMEEKIDRQAYAKHKNQQVIGQHSEVLQLISALSMMFNQMPNNRNGGGGGGNPGGNRMGGRMSNNQNGYGGAPQQNAG
jgi:RNA recognition motif-containing protein